MDYELEVSTQLNELIQHAYLMIDYSSAEALQRPSSSAKHAPAQGLLGMPYPERSS